MKTFCIRCCSKCSKNYIVLGVTSKNASTSFGFSDTLKYKTISPPPSHESSDTKFSGTTTGNSCWGGLKGVRMSQQLSRGPSSENCTLTFDRCCCSFVQGRRGTTRSAGQRCGSDRAAGSWAGIHKELVRLTHPEQEFTKK